MCDWVTNVFTRSDYTRLSLIFEGQTGSVLCVFSIHFIKHPSVNGNPNKASDVCAAPCHCLLLTAYRVVSSHQIGLRNQSHS